MNASGGAGEQAAADLDGVLDDGALDDGVLDDPVWWSLQGAHAHLAERVGDAVGYPADVSPFVASDPASVDPWPDLATLLASRPPHLGVLTGRMLDVPELAAPADWTAPVDIGGLQLVGPEVEGRADPELLELGPADHADMLELADRTRPGPFALRTPELGRFVGLRVDGRLVAMSGERMRPGRFVEVSAVCTDPDFRGRGLAERTMRAIIAGIRERGFVPFLHVAAGNEGAIRLYERMGFRRRRAARFRGVVPPGFDPSGIADPTRH